MSKPTLLVHYKTVPVGDGDSRVVAWWKAKELHYKCVEMYRNVDDMKERTHSLGWHNTVKYVADDQ